MRKVLLVDDEISILEGLRSLIRWEEYNYSVAGKATDGLEAMDLATHEHFDLIIADIRMPGLSGLELIRRLNEINYAGKIVILSGHSEFGYAKEAIEAGVSGYLLKPIDVDELGDLLARIDLELTEEESERHLARQGEAMMRENLLQQIVTGALDPRAAADEMPPLRRICEGVLFCVCIVYADEYVDMPGEERVVQADVLTASIADLLKREIDDYRLGYVFKLENKRIGILLVQGSQGQGAIARAIRSVSVAVRTKLPVLCTLVIGSEEPESSLIHDSYLNALKVINYRLPVGQGEILHYSDLQWLNARGLLRYRWDFSPLIRAVFEGDAEQIELSVGRFTTIAASNSWPLEIAHSKVVQLMIELASAVDKAGGDAQELFNIDLIVNEIHPCMVITELGNILRRKCDQARTYYRENISSGKSESRIKKVIEYVDASYNKSINLKTIAHTFGMNPVYLGRIFKQRTGTHFTKYINERRIECAEKLLAETSFTVADICLRAGFNGIGYFYQIFRESHGMTPLEYRRKIAYR
jgi:two-component system, response regulator YesN